MQMLRHFAGPAGVGVALALTLGGCGSSGDGAHGATGARGGMHSKSSAVS